MHRNIKLEIAYDGTSFYGWQETHEGPSIEGVLRNILEQILQERITLQAASRTDRGVHAIGQVVNFFTTKPHALPSLKKSMNALLPVEIRVLEAHEMPLSFHPTLDSIGKEYHYALSFGEIQLPQKRLYAWHVPFSLDVEKMKEGARHFFGTHDFSSFCNMRKNLNYPDMQRQICNLEIDDDLKGEMVIKVAGNHFLYKMVRNIVGTLAYVGQGKMDPEEISAILDAKSRNLAGVTAPAHGLTLAKIYYPDEIDSLVFHHHEHLATR
jgi:tRNA pseudouridine38-40 synthase